MLDKFLWVAIGISLAVMNCAPNTNTLHFKIPLIIWIISLAALLYRIEH